jgi:hypothetical protein
MASFSLFTALLFVFSALFLVSATPVASEVSVADVLLKRTDPSFPSDIPSCQICQSEYSGISSCAQAAPVLANFTMVRTSASNAPIYDAKGTLRSSSIPVRSSTSSSARARTPSNRPTPNALTGTYSPSLSPARPTTYDAISHCSFERTNQTAFLNDANINGTLEGLRTVCGSTSTTLSNVTKADNETVASNAASRATYVSFQAPTALLGIVVAGLTVGVSLVL